MSHRPVSVTRVVAAPPATVFAIVADPRRHADIDGSGMVGASVSAPDRLQRGSRFTMAMRQFGVPYQMTNDVTEFEDGHLIAWRPWARVGGVTVTGGVTWRYRVEPEGDGSLVTETYDVTTGRGSHALAALGYPRRMERAMTATLARLADVAENGPTPA